MGVLTIYFILSDNMFMKQKSNQLRNKKKEQFDNGQWSWKVQPWFLLILPDC